MDGLEKIIGKIENDAEAAAESVISGAKEKAGEIIAQAESSGDLEARDIIAEAKKNCDTMIMKADSGGELMKKKMVLSRKVSIIDNAISRAVENFMYDDPAAYFDAMIRLAEKYAPEGDLDMIFSDRDAGRLPADFEKRVNDAAARGGRITVKGGGSSGGGFLLVSDDLVENCTIPALIRESETEIRDELCRILFAN